MAKPLYQYFISSSSGGALIDDPILPSSSPLTCSKPRRIATSRHLVPQSTTKARSSAAPSRNGNYDYIDDEHPHAQLLKKNTHGKAPKGPKRRLVTISTSDGKWHGQWTCDYVLSLRELQLADLAEEGQRDAEVLVSLSIEKHAGFGFSVEGRIITSFTRKCSSCFSPYSGEIDTSFDVWVLPTGRSSPLQLPEIGGNDPSVIYVKRGSEADLDSLIQDTIRLAVSAKNTCSEACENSSPRWNYTDGKDSYDMRWSRLLEIKKAF